MRLLESATDYVLRETGSEPLAFIIVLVLLSFLIFMLFQVPRDIYLDNKLYLILSLIPSVIAFAYSIYMASYGKDGLQIFNPGVYLISLLVFSVFFGMAVLLDYGFGVVIDR